MNRIRKEIQFIYKLQSFLVVTLLASFLFVMLHTFIHNNSKHTHDTSCNVYILEQLYSSADILEVETIFILFLPFLFLLFIPNTCVEIKKHFTIRAPPFI